MKQNSKSKRTSKRDLQIHLEIRHNMSAVTAMDVVDSLLGLIREELYRGNKVTLNGIGTLTPVFKKPGKVKMFGKEKEAAARMHLRFEVSRTIDSTYKQHIKNDVSKSMRSLIS